MSNDEIKVRSVYPDAFIYMCKTYAGAKEYTAKIPGGKAIGPTAFTMENAWHYAAERLRKAEVAI